MVYFNGQPVTNHHEATLLIWLILVGVFLYALPSLYNFWILFKKAGKPGWAAIIPIYNTIVYAQIAKKPIWLGVLMGLTEIQVSGSNISIALPIIESSLFVVLGLIILSSFVKQYKAKAYQWALLILLPIAASFMINNFAFQKTIKR